MLMIMAVKKVTSFMSTVPMRLTLMRPVYEKRDVGTQWEVSICIHVPSKNLLKGFRLILHFSAYTEGK
jgi:hypothetical protein